MRLSALAPAVAEGVALLVLELEVVLLELLVVDELSVLELVLLDENELVDVGIKVDEELDEVVVGGTKVLVLCWVEVGVGAGVEEDEEDEEPEEPSAKSQLP